MHVARPFASASLTRLGHYLASVSYGFIYEYIYLQQTHHHLSGVVCWARPYVSVCMGKGAVFTLSNGRIVMSCTWKFGKEDEKRQLLSKEPKEGVIPNLVISSHAQQCRSQGRRVTERSRRRENVARDKAAFSIRPFHHSF